MTNAFSEAITALRLIAEWDYTNATDEDLQDLVGAAAEVVNQAEAERRQRAVDRRLQEGQR